MGGAGAGVVSLFALILPVEEGVMAGTSKEGLTVRRAVSMRRFAIALGMTALSLPIFDVSTASAVVCAAGVHRAGCVGARGAVVTRRPVYRRPYHRCYWRAGVHVCT